MNQAVSLACRGRALAKREVRGNLGGLIALPVAVTLIVVALANLTRRRVVEEEIALPLAALCSYASALLILGSDCVAGELARGTLSSLARAPGGLAAAFRAKLLLLLAGALLAALGGAFGFALASDANLASVAELVLQAFSSPAALLGFALPALGLALWVFAASCWVPTGVLALPTAALAAVAVGAAFWFTPGLFGRSGPNAPDVILFVVSYVVAGFVAARWSFVRGHDASVDRLRSGWMGLRAAALALLPAFAVAAVRPDDDVLTDVRTDIALRLPVLDVENGLVRTLAVLPVAVDSAVLGKGAWWEDWSELLPYRTDAVTEHLVTIDAHTGEWSSVRTDDDDAIGQLTAYRAAWEAHEAQPDLAEHGIPQNAKAIAERGLGRLIVKTEADGTRKAWVHDPLRDLVVPHDEFADGMRILVRRADWLIGKRLPGREPTFSWERFDPLLETSAPALGIEPDDLLTLVLPDDRIVASNGREAHLVDPATGSRIPLLLDSGRAMTVLSGSWNAPPQMAEPIVAIVSTERGPVLARIDAEKSRLKKIQPKGSWRYRVLGILEDGRIVGCADDRTIVVSSLDGTHIETLFPRSR